MLHYCRRFEYCRDVIILGSESTPEGYLAYLKERNFRYHLVGPDHVDLKRALELLSDTYGVRTVLTDTGQILGNLLLDQELVSEISLLVHPVIVGARSFPIFGGIRNPPRLRLEQVDVMEKEYLWQVYGVER
jgi:2,5-diamino-6-(ribosylamino)-4(3H)-pyrimidinone 5'-phosphate reductase